MDASEALPLSNSIRNLAVGQQRVGVTDLARSTSWRKRLAECKILEIVDRGSTAGWLLSEDALTALLDTISYFESEAERTQVAYIVEMREGYSDWASGEALKQQVLASADGIVKNLEAAFDGD